MTLNEQKKINEKLYIVGALEDLGLVKHLKIN